MGFSVKLLVCIEKFSEKTNVKRKLNFTNNTDIHSMLVAKKLIVILNLKKNSIDNAILK